MTRLSQSQSTGQKHLRMRTEDHPWELLLHSAVKVSTVSAGNGATLLCTGLVSKSHAKLAVREWERSAIWKLMSLWEEWKVVYPPREFFESSSGASCRVDQDQYAQAKNFLIGSFFSLEQRGNHVEKCGAMQPGIDNAIRSIGLHSANTSAAHLSSHFN